LRRRPAISVRSFRTRSDGSNQKEESLDKKSDLIEKREGEATRRERELTAKEKNAQEKEERFERGLREQRELLEKIASMTAEEAKTPAHGRDGRRGQV